MLQIDRVVHEPARLMIMMALAGVEWAEFPSLCGRLDLTRGNLSAHISRLERRGYIQVKKGIIGKTPHTQCHLTKIGRAALEHYWNSMDKIRRLGEVSAP